MQSLDLRGFVGGGEAIGMVGLYRDHLVGTVLSGVSLFGMIRFRAISLNFSNPSFVPDPAEEFSAYECVSPSLFR